MKRETGEQGSGGAGRHAAGSFRVVKLYIISVFCRSFEAQRTGNSNYSKQMNRAAQKHETTHAATPDTLTSCGRSFVEI